MEELDIGRLYGSLLYDCLNCWLNAYAIHKQFNDNVDCSHIVFVFFVSVEFIRYKRFGNAGPYV